MRMSPQSGPYLHRFSGEASAQAARCRTPLVIAVGGWLCSAVMRNGGVAASGWLRQLEGETGVAPLWEALFQLAAHPVPQVPPASLPPSRLGFQRSRFCSGSCSSHRCPLHMWLPRCLPAPFLHRGWASAAGLVRPVDVLCACGSYCGGWFWTVHVLPAPFLRRGWASRDLASAAGPARLVDVLCACGSCRGRVVLGSSVPVELT